MAVFDGLRTPLPRDLGPGASVTLRATIQAPREGWQISAPRDDGSGSSCMVFRQRWGPCLNTGLSKIESLKDDAIFPSSCKIIGYGLLNSKFIL